jgi:hypothetical protein
MTIPRQMQSIGSTSTTSGTKQVVRSRSTSPTGSVGSIELPDSMPNISLFLPYIYPNITQERICSVFANNRIGDVNHVDFVDKIDKSGRKYKSAYIHFEEWYVNKTSYNFQEKVTNPEKEARIVYDDPYYWTVLPNTSQPEEQQQEEQQQQQQDTTNPNTTTSANIVPSIIKLKALLGVDTNKKTHMQAVAATQQEQYDDESDINEEYSLVDVAYVAAIEKQNKEFYEKICRLENHIVWLNANHLVPVMTMNELQQQQQQDEPNIDKNTVWTEEDIAVHIEEAADNAMNK